MLTKLGVALLTVASLSQMVSSCRNDTSPTSDTLAITNRTLMTQANTILMLKFKTAPLLSTATRSDAKLVIDEKQKEALLKEHAEAEAFLSKLSREIKILHRYKLLLNGFSVVVPTALIPQVSAYSGFAESRPSQTFSIPDLDERKKVEGKVGVETSVKFIGAKRVHEELNKDGTGIRVGVIDTGIDYTHAMFGGLGTVEAYAAAMGPVPKGYPNAKVVGGIDLVGSDYDDASPRINKRIPAPSANPLDEQGHGTHVAGTIAGMGDGINTYTGVAPGAQLYAIRVFGKTGSTSDAVVIAGLEYAVNPSGNLDPNDHLDVVNLSLGSPFGVPYSLYDEAMANLTKAGVVAVVSAGNSGNIPYVIGSPSSSDETISVAASIDNQDQNWKYKGVLFTTPSMSFPSRMAESEFAKPVDQVGDLSGSLYYIGLADKDLSEEQKAGLRGKVALIDRGGVGFVEKMKRAADAGAVGTVFINNVDGSVSAMGGEGQFDIPAVIIPKDVGKQIKESLAKNEDVKVRFKFDTRIEEPSNVDTLTSFTSRGPRPLDSGIKPEVSAPGNQIISAKMGSGNEGSMKNGTSMAAPHVAGCAALIKQVHPDWTPNQIKSSLMTSSVTLKDKEGAEYSVAHQGAGRVDIFKSMTQKPLAVFPSSIALGEIEVFQKKELRKSFQLENLSAEDISVYFKTELPGLVKMEFPNSVTIKANSSVQVPYSIFVQSPMSSKFKELSGFVNVMTEQGELVAKIPTLAEVRTLSVIKAESLKVHASNRQDAHSSPAELTLKNEGPTTGSALIFNFIGANPRREPVGPEKRRPNVCDLESVSYRTVEKTQGTEKVKYLQFAAKLHSPITNWELCELSILIGDDNGTIHQELIGGTLYSLDNAKGRDSYQTMLTNAHEMRKLRFLSDLSGKTADYTKAMVDMQELKTFDHGTLMILNVPLSELKVIPFGLLKVKIASTASVDTFVSSDHYLGGNQQWWTIDPFETASPYYGMPESADVPANSTLTVPLTHGEGTGDLIVYYPFNKSSRTGVKDLQSEIVKEEFLY